MNFDDLVRPLNTPEGSCGSDMIFSADFDEIQEARRFDDPSLSQGEWVTEIKEADWEKVIRVGETLLSAKAKDLRVAAWLTEAHGKLKGLSGLAEGYALLSYLCDAFWDDIHPLAEDGDLEQRIGVMDWLVSQTARLIREAPLTSSPKGHYSMIDQESARTTAKNIERNPGMADEILRNAATTIDAFESAVRDTPASHFVGGLKETERLKDAMKSLQMVLDLRMGEHAPAFGPTFDALDDVFRFFRRHAGEISTVDDRSTTATESETHPDTNGRREPTIGASLASHGGPVQSREQAIRQLQEIAAFFRRTEPHSPVAYLADKAARWGSMSLHEWLRTVVKDDAALSRMEEMLGVDTRPQEQI